MKDAVPKHESQSETMLETIEHAKKQLRVFLKRHELEYVWDIQNNDLKSDWSTYIQDKNTVFYETLLQLNQVHVLPSIKTWIEREIENCNPSIFSSEIILRLNQHYGSPWICQKYMASPVKNITNSWTHAMDCERIYPFWRQSYSPESIFQHMLTSINHANNANFHDIVGNILTFGRHWGSKGVDTQYNAWVSVLCENMRVDPKTWHKALASQMMNKYGELNLSMPLTIYHEKDRDIWNLILQTMRIPEGVYNAVDGYTCDPRIDRTLYRYAYEHVPKKLIFQKGWSTSVYDPRWIEQCIDYALKENVDANKWLGWLLMNDIHIHEWSEAIVEKAKMVSAKYPMLLFENTNASFDMSMRAPRVVEIGKTKDMYIAHLDQLLENAEDVIPELKNIHRVENVEQKPLPQWHSYLLTKINPSKEWSMQEIENIKSQYNTWKEIGVSTIDALRAILDAQNIHTDIQIEMSHYDI